MLLPSNAHLFNLSVFCDFVQDWTDDFLNTPPAGELSFLKALAMRVSFSLKAHESTSLEALAAPPAESGETKKPQEHF